MAITTDVKYIRDHFEEFDSVDKKLIERWLIIAKLSVNEKLWSDKANHAVALLTCHFLATSTSGEASKGEIVAEKAGDLSVRYADNSGSNDNELKQTQYGIQYVFMRKSLVITPMVTC